MLLAVDARVACRGTNCELSNVFRDEDSVALLLLLLQALTRHNTRPSSVALRAEIQHAGSGL
jgi:hypothetical protein